MLANQLGRRGVRTLISDRHAGPARETRALGVQARTLEIYSKLGIVAEALRLGRMLAALTPSDTETLGLLALIELQASRLPARTICRGGAAGAAAGSSRPAACRRSRGSAPRRP